MNQITVRAVLFGDADPVGALSRAAGWRSVLGGLGGVLSGISSSGRHVVEREMSSAVTGLLGLEVSDVLVGGWRRHHALVSAAEATQSNPLATEVVQLATHRISTAHRPYVDVLVSGAKIATVHFDLAMTFDIDGVLGTVRYARLVALHGGRCTVIAWLGCEGREIASRQTVIDPALMVPLGDGIPLLEGEHKHSLA